jgi:microcompartment protein CcmL/EutN
MMLRYSLNLPKEAAVRTAIDAGLRTKDMGGSATTKEAGDKIKEALVKVLSGQTEDETSQMKSNESKKASQEMNISN